MDINFFSSRSILPSEGMSSMDRLNAMLRFVVIITVILFGLGFDFWWQFFIIALLIILVVAFFSAPSNTPDEEDS